MGASGCREESWAPVHPSHPRGPLSTPRPSQARKEEACWHERKLRPTLNMAGNFPCSFVLTGSSLLSLAPEAAVQQRAECAPGATAPQSVALPASPSTALADGQMLRAARPKAKALSSLKLSQEGTSAPFSHEVPASLRPRARLPTWRL